MDRKPHAVSIDLPDFTEDQKAHIQRIADAENSFDPKAIIGPPRLDPITQARRKAEQTRPTKDI
jgi:hypothetical protein